VPMVAVIATMITHIIIVVITTIVMTADARAVQGRAAADAAGVVIDYIINQVHAYFVPSNNKSLFEMKKAQGPAHRFLLNLYHFTNT
jgi:hypothetical protein